MNSSVLIVRLLRFCSNASPQSRNFTCCGIHLTDLHAVVEHFEVVHVVVADQQALAGQYQDPLGGNQSYYPDNNQVQSTYQHAFDPDDMELEMDNNSQPSSGGSTPPDTPINTPLSSYPDDGFNRTPSYPGSNCASPYVGSPPVSAFDTVVLPSQHIRAFPHSRGGRPALANVSDVFNGYSGYSDYSSCMPGTVPSPPAYDELSQTQPNSASEPGSPSGCVPPALLYSSGDNTPISTPSSSRIPSPTSSSSYFTTAPGSSTNPASSSAGKGDPSSATPRASTTLSRPASSLLLSKPFRCPKPNCNKSYKQANGLKYHMTHGSCNFAPPKDLEQVQALLASKRSQRQAAEANGEEVDSFGVISEGEMREVEREAERRLRPFACGVADCQRRYKNMNGLRYHYQHSGDHGAIGLALLASGQHECLQNAHGKSAHSSRHSTPGRNTVTSAPSQAQQQQQHQLQLQGSHYHQQQSQMQAQQTSFSSSAQPQQQQQFMHSQQQLQPQHFGNTMTAPMAMPSAGMYMSRDAYMSG
jgi:transcription factor SFP1